MESSQKENQKPRKHTKLFYPINHVFQERRSNIEEIYVKNNNGMFQNF